jgi:hypothetical protein
VAHTPCSPRPFGPTGPSRARAFPPSSLCPGGPARQRGHFPRACAHSPALSTRGPPLSVPSSPCNRRPSCAYRSLRAHVAREARNRPALGHLSPRASLTLSPPQLRTCRTPFHPPPRYAHARASPPLPAAVPSPFPHRRRSPAVPSATVSFASTSATRDTAQFLLSLPNSLCPRSPVVVRHRRPEPSPHLRRHREVPGVRLEVRNLPCPLPCSLLRLIPRWSRLAPPPSHSAVGRPLRCPYHDLAPASKFPAPSPTSQTIPVVLRPAEPPRPSSPVSSPAAGATAAASAGWRRGPKLAAQSPPSISDRTTLF